MKLVCEQCGDGDYSIFEIDQVDSAMEYQLINTVEKMFPEAKQMFYYDSDGYPAVDILEKGVVNVRLCFREM